VDGVADAGDGAVVGDGDLLGARGGEAGGVTAAEVVHDGGVGPVGLDGGVAVVHALVAVDGAVNTSVHVRDLVVIEPALVDVVGGDVGSA
jgi:hypothetical protein